MTDTDSAGGAASDASFDPIAFLETAVQHPSHEDVGPMREFLCETLEARGLEPRVDDAGNVLASRGLPASDAETHVVLNTHIDTVSPHVPYERDDGCGDAADAVDSDSGVIRGRGSCDAKGPLAALLSAFFAVEPTDSRVTLAITPDEEVLSTGAYALVEGDDSPTRDADAVIVGEPTDLDVCTAAKGRFQGMIHLSGANAHAAEPETGTNAVAALESALKAVRTFGERADTPPTHPQLGAATLTPTVVEGGEATNQVPADCALTVDRRSVPPETADEFHEALTAHLRAALPEDVGLEFRFTDRPTPFLEAWDTDPDAAVAQTLATASGGEIRPFTAATEASYFAADSPTVVFGPGVLADDEGAVAHAPREYVRVDAVREAARALEATLTKLVG
ncbi:M20 family metallopeptidase [Natrinema versiforme]|uniref:Succinyl-diaminopimelate desuccinylase n=1 Tax=Natrinema versiforme JCM 10478 TaxID=1227496 RepID=L9YD83_9EURY|nr:M20 family metallopeptidase [Natrinema versiforme]ELY70883.1 succinyl-diaminopimelate desuccinylase [Natrinema versiforme JCM 10478]